MCWQAAIDIEFHQMLLEENQPQIRAIHWNIVSCWICFWTIQGRSSMVERNLRHTLRDSEIKTLKSKFESSHYQGHHAFWQTHRTWNIAINQYINLKIIKHPRSQRSIFLSNNFGITGGYNYGITMVEGSLEVKLPTIWRDEKQSRAEAERRERLEERRSEEKE